VAFDVNAGTYTVTENVPGGWTLISAFCDNGSPVGAIQVQIGETVNCFFVNMKQPEDPLAGAAAITIIKDARPDDVQDFSFTGSGPIGNFVLDDDPNSVTQKHITFVVSEGIYSIRETVPVGWELARTTCSDNSKIDKIIVSAREHVICTFTNDKFPDHDNDGIFNDVDTLPFTFSNDFSDIVLGGTTTGTIASRGDQIVKVREESQPDGVRIRADATGIAPASITACGGAAILSLSDGDEVIVTCSSATIQVISGIVKVTFVTSDGRIVTSNLNAGNGVIFVPDSSTLNAPLNNSDTVVILVNGKEFHIAPGKSIKLVSFVRGTFAITATGIVTREKNAITADSVNVALDLSASYQISQSTGLKIINDKVTGTLTTSKAFGTVVKTFKLKDIKIAVSKDLKKLTIEAKFDGVPDRVSAVLPFKAAIDFENGTDSKTTRGTRLIAEVGAKIYDTQNSAHGSIAFG
jgi:hypothetical protein